MCDWGRLIAVTDRRLCAGDFLARIEKIAALGPRALILREKDLSPEDYALLAERVLDVCGRAGVPCFLHTHAQLAAALGCGRIHLSVPALEALRGRLEGFETVSVSCHSLADVRLAEAAGAGQIVLGHIFATDCKAGLPGRGLDFLRKICNQTALPVYAIGGITPANLPRVLDAGAAGGCMMSGFMEMDLG